MTSKISIMKMGGIASLVSVLAFGSPAQALTFNWSFTATGEGGSGAALGTVSGTISGVQDNTTTNSGLTAIVLSTPDGQNQGVTFSSLVSGGITVASGVVTSYNLMFSSGNDNLNLDSGFPNYYIDSPYYTLYNDVGGAVTFSPVATPVPVPFDFDPSFGVVALGGIWAGRKAIKKIAASKKAA